MTPAKTKRTESLGGPSSPQPAACAPSGAALPLPSSTTSPIQSKDAKAAAVRQRMPSSIKMWLSPNHGSPTQTSPTARRVLSPCPQTTASSTSPTEQRAKRRLETGHGASPACEGVEHCDCVAQLFPATKRSRTLSDFCHPAQAEVHCVTEDKRSSSIQTGKENYSPRVMDWLSVMGQTMRKGHESPNVSKKHENKMPTSPVSTGLPHSLASIITILNIYGHRLK